MSKQIEPGGTLILSYQHKQGAEDIYPQAKIYDDASTLIATVNLTHRQNGLYTGTTTTLSSRGLYTSQIIPYTDSGHTSISPVDEIIEESIYVEFPYRPAMGASISTAELSKDTLEPILDRLKDIEEELKKKSEFNPNIDKVLTNIPSLNLRDIKEKIDNGFAIVNNKISELQKKETAPKGDDTKMMKSWIDDESTKMEKLANIIKTSSNTDEVVAMFNSIKGQIQDRNRTIETQKDDNYKKMDGLQKQLNDIKFFIKSEITELNSKVITHSSKNSDDLKKQIKALALLSSELGDMLEVLNKENFKRNKEIKDTLLKIFEDIKLMLKQVVNDFRAVIQFIRIIK